MAICYLNECILYACESRSTPVGIRSGRLVGSPGGRVEGEGGVGRKG